MLYLLHNKRENRFRLLFDRQFILYSTSAQDAWLLTQLLNLGISPVVDHMWIIIHYVCGFRRGDMQQ
jgi:hypothetical protein